MVRLLATRLICRDSTDMCVAQPIKSYIMCDCSESEEYAVSVWSAGNAFYIRIGISLPLVSRIWDQRENEVAQDW